MSQWFEWLEAPAGDFAVIGDPVGHSKSPSMHAAAYSACGLELTYRAIRVPAAEFVPALAHLTTLGYRGLNVTVPLKGHACLWAMERGGLTGAELGAEPGVSANTINLRTKQAISTDEPGFIKMFDTIWPKGSARILMLGAGGTAFALAPRLATAGHRLSVWNRTPGKWEKFIEEKSLEASVVEAPSAAGFDVVINCTSAGLSGQELPVSWDGASPWLAAIDLVYGKETPFLKSARFAGVTGHDGTLMLMEQGALSFEWWLGIPAPREDMLKSVQDGHP